MPLATETCTPDTSGSLTTDTVHLRVAGCSQNNLQTVGNLYHRAARSTAWWLGDAHVCPQGSSFGVLKNSWQIEHFRLVSSAHITGASSTGQSCCAGRGSDIALNITPVIQPIVGRREQFRPLGAVQRHTRLQSNHCCAKGGQQVSERSAGVTRVCMLHLS